MYENKTKTSKELEFFLKHCRARIQECTYHKPLEPNKNSVTILLDLG